MASGASQPEADRDPASRSRARSRCRSASSRRWARGRSAPARTSIVAHDPALRPEDGLSVSTWIWLAPDAPRGGRRALLATWGENGDGWALVLDADGRPCFEVGAGGRRDRVAGSRAGRARHLGAARGRARPGRRDARARPTGAGAGGTWRPSTSCRPARGGRAGTGARAAAARRASRGRAAPPRRISTASSTGRRSRPGPAGETRVAAWRLGEGRGRRVLDDGPRGLHGSCVNGPLRGGHRPRPGAATSTTGAWRRDQYGAMHFHSDAIDDLGWPPSFEFELPDSLPGGVYAARPLADGVEDVVPFAVRRAPARRAGRERRSAADLHLPGVLVRARGSRDRRIAAARGPVGRRGRAALPL